MNLPEIYESDYFEMVQRVHKEQNPVNSDRITIYCKTTKYYTDPHIEEDFKYAGCAGIFAMIDFTPHPQSIITGLRYWSLNTKIILVPDINMNL